MALFRQKRHIQRVRRAVQGPFAFIHINKCGGSSIEAALGLPIIHHTAKQRCDLIGVERWNSIPSFALVRDPYAKVCSHYRYRVKTNQTGMGSTSLDLNEWIARAYGERARQFYDKPVMFASCKHWISDEDGAVIVDLVVKLEDIDAEWPKVEAHIGKSGVLPKRNETTKNTGTIEDALNAESIAIINQRFEEDFATFGYEKR